eukprot:3616693-Pyramimonas_sp.AAC.1
MLRIAVFLTFHCMHVAQNFFMKYHPRRAAARRAAISGQKMPLPVEVATRKVATFRLVPGISPSVWP